MFRKKSKGYPCFSIKATLIRQREYFIIYQSKSTVMLRFWVYLFGFLQPRLPLRPNARQCRARGLRTGENNNPSALRGAGAPTNCSYSTTSSCVLMIIYCVSTPAKRAAPSRLQKPARLRSSCFTDASRNARPFFCGRMVLSFAPDSCASLVVSLSPELF